MGHSSADTAVTSTKLGSVLQIMGGVHENMLTLPYMDHSLERTVAMCDWLQHFDVWHTRCNSRQQYELMPLLPAAVLAVANLCCSTAPLAVSVKAA